MKKLILSLLLLITGTGAGSFAQNVGISSDVNFNPQNQLHIHSTSTGSVELGRYTTSTTGSTNMNGVVYGFANTGYNFYFDNKDGGGYQWWTSGVERMRMTGSGNVGINTQSPENRLQVNGNGRFGTSANNYVYLASGATTGNGGLEIFTSGNAAYIRYHDPWVAWRDIALNDAGGNVGIGTISPTRKLDVDGETRIRDLPFTILGNISVVVADSDGVLKSNNQIGISEIADCNLPGTYSLPVYVWYGSSWSNENSWQLRTGLNWNSGVIISGGPGNNNTVQYDGNVTLNNGQTYYFEARDSYGDGWNGGGYFNLGSPINSGNITPTGFGTIFTFSYSPCNNVPTLQRFIRGSINESGEILGGGGFSCSAFDNGRYELTFITPFADRPSASVTQVFSGFDSNGWGGNTRDNAVITHLDQNKIRIVTGDGNGNQVNRSFSFIICGSQ